MSRVISPGVVTDDLPEDHSQPIENFTQWPDTPCPPECVHDRYIPVGLKPGDPKKFPF